MRRYKVVHLNQNLKLSIGQDLSFAEKKLNSYIEDGWKLQNVVASSYHGLVGIFYKDQRDDRNQNNDE